MSLTVFFFSQALWANSYIVCGSGAYQEDGMEFENPELVLSSENDKYTGKVGKNWNMHLGDGNWIEKGNITAKTVELPDGTKNVEIEIVQAMGATGPVGQRYILTDLYSDEPSLQKFTIGGFVGLALTGTYGCHAAFD